MNASRRIQSTEISADWAHFTLDLLSIGDFCNAQVIHRLKSQPRLRITAPPPLEILVVAVDEQRPTRNASAACEPRRKVTGPVVRSRRPIDGLFFWRWEPVPSAGTPATN